MSKRIFLLFCIIAFSLTPTVKGSYNHTELRNNFTSDQWYQSSDQVYRNSTLNAYLLNSSITPAYEDYTTYNSVEYFYDLIGLNSSHIEIKYGDPVGNTASYRWRYYYPYWVGLNKTTPNTDIIYEFDLLIDAVLSDSLRHKIVIFQLSNITEDYRYIDNNNNNGFFVTCSSYFNSSGFYLGLINVDNGAYVQNHFSNEFFGLNNWYYIQINRTGSTYNLNVFLDEDRTNLYKTLSLTIETPVYNFNKFFQVCNVGFTSYSTLSGYIKNSNWGATDSTYPNGTLYFKNLLDNTTSPATWYLSNQELNGGLLNVSFSSNNITWFGETPLTEGYNALNLEPYNYTDLYVKYDFIPGSDTPRINNASVMYQGSTGTGGPTTTIYVYRYGVAIILLILGVMFGTGIKRE